MDKVFHYDNSDVSKWPFNPIDFANEFGDPQFFFAFKHFFWFK